MIRLLFAALLLLVSAPALCQEAVANCPEFTESKGVSLRFSNEAWLRQYGFQSFQDEPGAGGKSIAFERLAGKLAKVNPEASADGILRTKYHAVIVEDCQRVFWHNIDGNLNAADARSANITFLELPPTKWTAVVSVDRLTDKKSCMVRPEADLPFPILHVTRAGLTAAVVGGDFPGRPHTFRVDKKAAIREEDGLSGPKTQLLVSQIRAGGKRLLTGSYEWPDDIEEVAEFNLGGILDKLDECKKAIAQP